MDWIAFVFYCFAAIVVISATAVISVRNPVHAVLCLILTFFSTACIWVLLGAEFLGVTLILVYVGAVMVMFLFVVMMLDAGRPQVREGWVRYLPAGIMVASLMLAELLSLLVIHAHGRLSFPHDGGHALEQEGSNLLWLARALCTRYVLPFEFAAILLTVAVISAVMLTLRHRKGVKTQNPAQQVHTQAKDRLTLISIPAERHSAVSVGVQANPSTQQVEK